MGEAPYVSKTKTILRARFNNYKRAHRSYKKNVKYQSNAFMNIMANAAIMKLSIGCLH